MPEIKQITAGSALPPTAQASGNPCGGRTKRDVCTNGSTMPLLFSPIARRTMNSTNSKQMYHAAPIFSNGTPHHEQHK
jgi:hypothetical protein